MAKITEEIGILTLKAEGSIISFPSTRKEHNWAIDVIGKVEFLQLEIKSGVPPTDCKMKIDYIKPEETTSNHFSIHFIKYRSKFVFENGYYILNLSEILDFPNGVIPHTVSFKNNRDVGCEANLVYIINYPEPTM